MSEKFYFCPSSSCHGAPVREGEVLIADQWHPARFEGFEATDSLNYDAFLPWCRVRVQAARIDGTLYRPDASYRAQVVV